MIKFQDVIQLKFKDVKYTIYVNIHKDKESLVKHISSSGNDIVAYFSVDSSNDLSLGFIENKFNGSMIIHEACHLVFYLFNLLELNYNDNEELFCDTLTEVIEKVDIAIGDLLWP